METIHNVFEYVVLGISTIGALVVFWGIIEAVLSFSVLRFSRGKKQLFEESETIRQRLGSHLLLGLEIFIGGDIISSVVSPSWDKVGILASIVAIRTVLSYFLRKELKQSLK